MDPAVRPLRQILQFHRFRVPQPLHRLLRHRPLRCRLNHLPIRFRTLPSSHQCPMNHFQTRLRIVADLVSVTSSLPLPLRQWVSMGVVSESTLAIKATYSSDTLTLDLID